MQRLKNLLMCSSGRALLLITYALSSIMIYGSSSLYLGTQLGIAGITYMISGDASSLSQNNEWHDTYINEKIESYSNTKNFLASLNPKERVEAKTLSPQEITEMREFHLKRAEKEQESFVKNQKKSISDSNKRIFLKLGFSFAAGLLALVFHIILYRRQRLTEESLQD